MPVCGLECANGRCVFDFMGTPTCRCDEGFEQKVDSGTPVCKAPGAPVCHLDCEFGRCVFDWFGKPECACDAGYESSGGSCVGSVRQKTNIQNSSLPKILDFTSYYKL